MIWRVATLLVLCGFAQICTSLTSFAGTLSWITQDRWVTVSKVVDGDTFKTRQGEKVRLLGINTPEIRHESTPALPFGQEAFQALRSLIEGKQVRLTFDQENKDKYGRTLAHVYQKDGTWVNAALLKLGLAHVYTFVPNTKEAKGLVQIEQQARSAQKGMWSHDRWQVLTPDQLKQSMLGQFRLVHGKVSRVSKHGWDIDLGKLRISVPRKYREQFSGGIKGKIEQKMLVRGRLRMSKKGQWYISVHSPSDAYHLK